MSTPAVPGFSGCVVHSSVICARRPTCMSSSLARTGQCHTSSSTSPQSSSTCPIRSLVSSYFNDLRMGGGMRLPSGQKLPPVRGFMEDITSLLLTVPCTSRTLKRMGELMSWARVPKSFTQEGSQKRRHHLCRGRWEDPSASSTAHQKPG